MSSQSTEPRDLEAPGNAIAIVLVLGHWSILFLIGSLIYFYVAGCETAYQSDNCYAAGVAIAVSASVLGVSTIILNLDGFCRKRVNSP